MVRKFKCTRCKKWWPEPSYKGVCWHCVVHLLIERDQEKEATRMPSNATSSDPEGSDPR